MTRILTTLAILVLAACGDSPSAPTSVRLAPVDQAAFDSLVVGKVLLMEVLTSNEPDAPDEVPFSFPSAGRARTVGNVITDWTYEYVSTGLNTGILTMAVDTTSEGYVIITQLTFTTTTSGTFTFSADNGEDTGAGNFRIIDA